jgi:hypothetical protein
LAKQFSGGQGFLDKVIGNKEPEPTKYTGSTCVEPVGKPTTVCAPKVGRTRSAYSITIKISKRPGTRELKVGVDLEYSCVDLYATCRKAGYPLAGSSIPGLFKE